MRATRVRLRQINRIYRQRQSGNRLQDRLYLLYVAAIVTLMLGAPLSIGAVDVLRAPAAQSLLTHPDFTKFAAITSIGVLLSALWVGRFQGPITLEPFFALLLAATDAPRSRTLWRKFAKVAAVIGVVFIVLVAIGITAHPAPAGIAPAFAFAGVIGLCAGVLIAMFALVGQAGSPPSRLVTTAVLIAVALATGLLSPAPALLLGTTLPGLTVRLAAVSALVLLVVPHLLRRLSLSGLLAAGQRWHSATTAVNVGNFAQALDLYKALPQWGRKWPAVPTNSGRALRPVAQYLRADTFAALRTPGRFWAGVAFQLVGWFLLWLGFGASAGASTLGWISAAIGGVIIYLSSGIFTDGFRYTAQLSRSPALYRYRSTKLLSLHGLFPLAMNLICAAAALGIMALSPLSNASVAVSGDTVATGNPWALAAVPIMAMPIMAVLPVVLRAFDSAKGDLPMELLAPIDSPMGDMSGLIVLLWQADAVVLMLTISAGLAWLATSGFVAILTGIAATFLVITLLLRSRLRS